MRISRALLAPAALITAAATAAAVLPAAAGERQPTSVTVEPPATTDVTLGTAVTAGGSVVGDEADRALHLRLKTPRGWMRIGSATRTDELGSFTVDVPTDWYYEGEVRVTVPRTRTHQAATSTAFPMAVGPTYTPVGDESDWSPWDYEARWNPCRVITYKVNRKGAPDGALGIIADAVAQVHQATGLRFEYVGKTKAIPFRDDGGKERSDAALDIAWASSSKVHELNGGTIGWGGVWWNGRLVNYRGGIALLRDSGMTTDDGPGGTWRNLVMHELGHVVGLDHAAGDDQVMYPMIPFSPGAFQAGDLAGLHHLGAANGCQGGKGRLRGTPGHASAG